MNYKITRNRLKDRLDAGKVAFGVTVRSWRTVDVAAAAGAFGYDYLFIDLEHGTLGVDNAAQICAAGVLADVTPIVRVPIDSISLAGRLLDSGAQGVVIPHVNSGEEAKAAVANCRFEPDGHRSAGGPTIHLGWQDIGTDQIAKALNKNTIVVVMIETGRAVENVEEIAATPGVDVLSVGTNDLCLDLGIPGQFHHERVLDAYTKVREAAQRHGKAIRLGGVYDTDDIIRCIGLGSRMVTLGSDVGFMHGAMKNKISDVRKRTEASLLD